MPVGRDFRPADRQPSRASGRGPRHRPQPRRPTRLDRERDRTARLWDAATGQPIGPPMEHRAEVIAVAFSPDGKTILTASPHPPPPGGRGAALWLWQTPSPFHDDPPRIAAWVEAATGLELDRQGSVRSLDNAAWRQRLDRFHRGRPASDRSPSTAGPDPVRSGSRRPSRRLDEPGPEGRGRGRLRRGHSRPAYDKAVWNAQGRFSCRAASPNGLPLTSPKPYGSGRTTSSSTNDMPGVAGGGGHDRPEESGFRSTRNVRRSHRFR